MMEPIKLSVEQNAVLIDRDWSKVDSDRFGQEVERFIAEELSDFKKLEDAVTTGLKEVGAAILKSNLHVEPGIDELCERMREMVESAREDLDKPDKLLQSVLDLRAKTIATDLDELMDNPTTMSKSENNPPSFLTSEEKAKWKNLAERVQPAMMAAISASPRTTEKEITADVMEHTYDYDGLRDEIAKFKKEVNTRITAELSALATAKPLTDRKEAVTKSLDAIEETVNSITAKALQSHLKSLQAELTELKGNIESYKNERTYLLKQIFSFGLYGKYLNSKIGKLDSLLGTVEEKKSIIEDKPSGKKIGDPERKEIKEAISEIEVKVAPMRQH